MKLLHSMILGLLCCSAATSAETRPQIVVTQVDFRTPDPNTPPPKFMGYAPDGTPRYAGEMPISIEISILDKGKISANHRILDVQTESAVDSKKNNLYPKTTYCPETGTTMARIHCSHPSRGAWIQVKGIATVAEYSAEKKTAYFPINSENECSGEPEGIRIKCTLQGDNKKQSDHRLILITAPKAFTKLQAQIYLHIQGEKIQLSYCGSDGGDEEQRFYYITTTAIGNTFDGITMEYPAKHSTIRIPFNFRASLRGVQYAKSTTQP